MLQNMQRANKNVSMKCGR